jgi:HSP20 family molecular chaperone IbpA
MTESEARELQVSEKKELASPAEQTKAGLVFTPNVDIFETENDITLLADIPGVKPDDLTIDLKDNVLTLSCEVKNHGSEAEKSIYSEYQTGSYYRQFSISELIDQSKIEAKVTDGVLRLALPKVEKAAPRRITVQAG